MSKQPDKDRKNKKNTKKKTSKSGWHLGGSRDEGESIPRPLHPDVDPAAGTSNVPEPPNEVDVDSFDVPK